MGPGLAAKSNQQVGAVTHRNRQPIRPADDEGCVVASLMFDIGKNIS